MKLQHKYLPTYDIHHVESIMIKRTPSEVFRTIQNLDFSDSELLYWLFKIRGMPLPDSLSLKGLENLNFVRLEEIENKELILGLIGKFWTIQGQLQDFQPAHFNDPRFAGFAKATWSFELTPLPGEKTIVKTETRVHCPNNRSRMKFRLYWFFIKPFSRLVRKKILQSIRRKAEQPGLPSRHLQEYSNQ